MKWGQAVIIIVVLFLMFTQSVVFVKGQTVNTYYLNGFYVNSWQGGFGTSPSGYGSMFVQCNGGSYSLNGINFSVFNVNGVSYLNAIIYNPLSGNKNFTYNASSFTIGSNKLVGFTIVYDKSILNFSLTNAVIEVKATFNDNYTDSYVNNTYIGSFYLKFKYLSSSSVSIISTSDVPSVSLTYNNDFTGSGGYGSASFSLTSNNFNISSVDVVRWLPNNNYTMQIYNYNVTKIDSSHYTISVNFVKVTDGSYTLDVWASGMDLYSNLQSMEANANFVVSGFSGSVPVGQLVISSPSEVYKIDLPQAGQVVTDMVTNFTLQYGGNAINDFGSNGRYCVSVISVKSGDASKVLQSVPLSNSGWVYDPATNISTATFSYKWLNAGDVSDYDIVFHAYIQDYTQLHTIYSQNTVEIILGSPSSSSGNIILDFLNHLWEEFKNWFVSIMQYLFVPTNSQMQAIGLTNGGLANEMKSYLPFLDLSSYGTDKIVFVRLSSLNNNYSDMYIDLSSSSLQGIFTFAKIGVDTIISILLLVLIYEVLK